MKAAFITAVFALFVSFVFAQSSNVPFYVTSPIVGTSYKAGSTVTLRWTNGVDEAAKVTVLTGTNAATMTPTGISFTIKGSDEEYEWKVPTNLPQKATFAFKIDYKDEKGTAGSTYSSGFTVTDSTGPVVSQSFVSSIASSSSAVPSSAVSSAVSSAASSVASRATVTPASSPVVTPRPTSASATATATPAAPTNAAAGLKAPSVAVCAIAIFASALFF